jgi:hypothetical protein
MFCARCLKNGFAFTRLTMIVGSIRRRNGRPRKGRINFFKERN